MLISTRWICKHCWKRISCTSKVRPPLTNAANYSITMYGTSEYVYPRTLSAYSSASLPTMGLSDRQGPQPAKEHSRKCDSGNSDVHITSAYSQASSITTGLSDHTWGCVHDHERPLALVIQAPQRDLPLVPRLIQVHILGCLGCLLLLLRLHCCLFLLLLLLVQ